MTTDPDAATPTGLQKAVNLTEVPPEKFSAMVGRSLLGALLVGLGLIGLVLFEMNHYLVVALVLLGATTWSRQVVTGSLKALATPFAAYRRAVDGKDSQDDQ